MWCSSKVNEAGASSAGCVLERSVHSDVRANPCAPAPSPGLVGESVGLPNQGRHRGMPPRIAFVPSSTAREESHSTSEYPVGRHDNRCAPKGVTRAEAAETSTLSVAMSVIVFSKRHRSVSSK